MTAESQESYEIESGGGRADASAASRRTALMVLLWIGMLSIVATATLDLAIYLRWGVHAPLLISIVVSALTLGFMFAENPGRTLKSLKRLWAVLVFAGITAVVVTIIVVRMQLGWQGEGRVLLGPLGWVAATVLGFAAARKRVLPLFVAAATVWVSAAVGMLDLAQSSGFSSALGEAYLHWSLALGRWVPGPTEGFRAVGLDVDPNTYGLIGVVALAFVVPLLDSARARAAVASGATIVIVLSGSRTAALTAVLILAAAFIFGLAQRTSLRELGRAMAPVVVSGLVTAALLAGGALLIPGLATTSERLAPATVDLAPGDVAAGDAAPAAPSGTDSLGLSGRVEIWRVASQLYAQNPAGLFLMPEVYLGRSVHNEYLERLLQGGPVMFAALLVLLGWMAVRLRPETAPGFGIAMAVAYGAAAMMLGPSWLQPFTAPAFYFIGWMTGQKRSANRVQE